ncbi:hypothetical protein [Geothrix sp. PMB-07]|uniref:hypothetical protein n=1 Tax=Geothrix sp. PMB-07 TaxID=3068640 RepID=UPI0027411649|nr:hypothetical protein [Geothrix sp. PMB-07]WLT31938.1 hypothetical protein Q9293_01145 [Geothrix sp. PMB-07]
MPDLVPDRLKAEILFHLQKATKEDILVRLKQVHALSEELLGHLYALAIDQQNKNKFLFGDMGDAAFEAVFLSKRAGAHAFHNLLRAFDSRSIEKIEHHIWAVDRLVPPDGIGQTMRVVLTADWSKWGRVREAMGITNAAIFCQLADMDLPPRDPMSRMRTFAFSEGEG